MCTQAQPARNVNTVKLKQGRDRDKRTFPHRLVSFQKLLYPCSTDPFHCMSFIVNVEAASAVTLLTLLSAWNINDM